MYEKILRFYVSLVTGRLCVSEKESGVEDTIIQWLFHNNIKMVNNIIKNVSCYKKKRKKL